MRARLLGVAMAMALAPQPALVQHPDLGGETLTNELCLSCHDSVQAAQAAGTPHKAVEAGCVVCHDIEKGESAPFLVAPVSQMCLGCHLGAAPSGVTRPSGLAATLKVPPTFLPRGTAITLDARGGGHPIAGHPVAGPRDPLKEDRAFSCVSCHVPHGGPASHLIAFTLKPGEGICQKCHKM